MKTIFEHEDGIVNVEELTSGKNRITVNCSNKEMFIFYSTWDTAYPVNLIEGILNLKGPAYLCDEIMRDESPDYVQKSLENDLLCFISDDQFKEKRILDFGCGSGASTMILGRMFPCTEIVGIELEENLLSIAKLRAEYYGFDKMQLVLSPSGDKLPPDIGDFDYIVLSAVFEHLLPNERKTLLPMLWKILKPGGVLFINQTPYRYFPMESHTTGGLPLVNYMPDWVAGPLARTMCKKRLKNNNWETLLRKGIRGGNSREILAILNGMQHKPVLLKPSRLGAKDRIDIWKLNSGGIGRIWPRKIFAGLVKILKALTGITFLPYLSLAVKKSPITN